MVYLIRLENGKPGIVGLPPEVSIEFAISPGQTWIEVASIPDAPIEALVVDWDTGAVSVAPDYAAPSPPPAYGAAWLELINSALYRRVLAALPTHNSVAIFTGAFLKSVDQDFTHQHWAGALSASAGNLAAAVNTTAEPLTAEEVAWVEDWSERHHLGLMIDWEAP